jgi:hypothetical protein
LGKGGCADKGRTPGKGRGRRKNGARPSTKAAAGGDTNSIVTAAQSISQSVPIPQQQQHFDKSALNKCPLAAGWLAGSEPIPHSFSRRRRQRRFPAIHLPPLLPALRCHCRRRLLIGWAAAAQQPVTNINSLVAAGGGQRPSPAASSLPGAVAGLLPAFFVFVCRPAYQPTMNRCVSARLPGQIGLMDADSRSTGKRDGDGGM